MPQSRRQLLKSGLAGMAVLGNAATGRAQTSGGRAAGNGCRPHERSILYRNGICGSGDKTGRLMAKRLASTLNDD